MVYSFIGKVTLPAAGAASSAAAGHKHIIDSITEADTAGLVWAFSLWRDKGVNTHAIARYAIDYFEFSPRLKQVLYRAADLAAEPSLHPYHNNTHFLEVFTLAATLGCRARLDKDSLALLLTAALVHDYHHDGKGNQGQKLRLEKIAADHANCANIGKKACRKRKMGRGATKNLVALSKRSFQRIKRN